MNQLRPRGNRELQRPPCAGEQVKYALGGREEERGSRGEEGECGSATGLLWEMHVCAKINGSLATNTPKKSLPASPYIDKNTPKLPPEESSRHPVRRHPCGGAARLLAHEHPKEGRAVADPECSPRAVCFRPRGARVLGFCTDTLPVRCCLFLSQECLRALSCPACLQCFSHQHLTPGPQAPLGGLVAAQSRDGGTDKSVCRERLLFSQEIRPHEAGRRRRSTREVFFLLFQSSGSTAGLEAEKERCVQARPLRGLKES